MVRTPFFILLFLPALLVANEKAKKDTLLIDEVVVQKVRPAEMHRNYIPMQSINRAGLDKLGSNTLADAVKNFSGLSLKDYGGIGGFKTVMVRSMGANHTGVFIDGVAFCDAATGQPDIGKLSVEEAQNISLFIGQPSQNLQPARMYAAASVLHLQLAQPKNNLKPISLTAGLKTGSFGFVNPSLTIKNKWPKFAFSNFNLSYTKANGNYPFIVANGNANQNLAYRKNSEIESLNLIADIQKIFTDSSEITTKIYYYASKRGLPGAVIFYNPYSAQVLWNNDFFGNVAYKKNVVNNLQWLGNAKYSQNYLRYFDPDYLNNSGFLDNRYRQNEYYISQAIQWEVYKKVTISAAFDFFVNTLKANLPNFAMPLRFTSLQVLSANYKSKRFETNGHILNTRTFEKVISGIAAKPRNIYSPALSAGYLLVKEPDIKLNIFYKDIFRMPTFNDLYYTQTGNINLLPESAKQYNTGISFWKAFGNLEYIHLKTDIFYNEVENKIVAVPTKNLYVWSMRNIGKVHTRGIEFQTGLQYLIARNTRLQLSANYTYQEALDFTSPASATYKMQIPYIPFETFNSVAAFSYKNANLLFNSRYNGYRYVLSENIYENMLPAWWLHDISYTYSFNLKQTKLSVKAEINNVTNRRYELIRSFPMPGRSFELGLKFEY